MCFMICTLHRTFIKVIKYKRMKWAKHVVCVGHNTGDLIWKTEGQIYSEDSPLQGIILKPIFKKQWDSVDWSNMSRDKIHCWFLWARQWTFGVTWKGLNLLNNWVKIPSHQWFCSTELFRVYAAVHIRMEQNGIVWNTSLRLHVTAILLPSAGTNAFLQSKQFQFLRSRFLKRQAVWTQKLRHVFFEMFDE